MTWNSTSIWFRVYRASKSIVIRISITDWKTRNLNLFLTVWKVSKHGVFSGPYFPVCRLNTEIYGVYQRIQSVYWKIRTRKTPYLDTFHEVSNTTLRKEKQECDKYSWGLFKQIRCKLSVLKQTYSKIKIKLHWSFLPVLGEINLKSCTCHCTKNEVFH